MESVTSDKTNTWQDKKYSVGSRKVRTEASSMHLLR
jgi:hypothetical protein